MRMEDVLGSLAAEAQDAVALHQGVVKDVSGPLPIVTVAGADLAMVATGSPLAEGDVVQVLSSGPRWLVLGTVTPGSGPNLVANPEFSYDLTGWGWDVAGTACEPLVIPAPLLHYRADDATGAEDDDVLTLASAVAGGPDLVATVYPTTGSGPPKLRIADLGSHQGIEFAQDHPGSWMFTKGDRLYAPVSPGFEIATHGGATVLAVARVYSGHGGMLDLTGPSGGGDPGMLSNVRFRADAFTANPAPADGQNMWHAFDATTDNVVHLFQWQFTQAGGTAGVAYLIDSGPGTGEFVADDPDPLTGRAADVTYGTADAGVWGLSLGDNLNGTIYEVRLYDGILAPDVLAAVRGELATAYGLTL